MTPTDAQTWIPMQLEELRLLLLARGHAQYTGEPVNHLEHALQCAALAQRAGAPAALMTAALLHDIGHLLDGIRGTPSLEGIDDRHEVRAAELLSRWFGSDVTEPVRLHVAAKRALAADSRYWRALSEDSRRSLALQGGAFDAAAIAAFALQPHAAEALALRRWDDAAKRPGRVTPTLDAFWPTVRVCARPDA
ncbi:HD domain-containing protein [Tibeticola sp.]|uniref:HD domain-containing protein n=1 Tax=Tibeticola sp. TaxID=2005368 RepID=UPI0025826515|nr:HD domain-containing protein [Tibeticola sp.]